MDWRLYLTGFFWGTLSAVSLPLGAMIGLWTRPPRKVTSALMAFGAGALLFALTTELFGHALHVASDQHGTIVNVWIVILTMTGAAAGGLLFELLNQILNNKGAFLRKGALIKKHVAREKRQQARVLFQGLSRVKVLQQLPAEEIIKLIPYLKTATFKQGQMIFKEGDIGDGLYFIVSGKVNVIRSTAGKSMPIATLGPGDIFGEMALFFSHARNATVTAQTSITLWQILKRENPMRYTVLGNSDLKVSAIGLGCSGMSQNFSPQTDAQSTAAIRRAVDRGINFFDTSDAYGNGHNENLLAAALKDRQESVVIATKFGNIRGPQGERLGINAKPEVVRQLKASGT